MIFKKKDGVWLDAMDSAIPLNQEKFEAMAQNFLNLHAISEIDLSLIHISLESWEWLQ